MPSVVDRFRRRDGVRRDAGTDVDQKLAFLGYFEWAVVFGLKLIPFVMSWLLFTFLYIFMPNTKVNLVSGIVGGVVAGTIYQATQMVYVTFQVGAAKANAIYGSFAALPLFLIWLQLSWRIVLFGTELVFAHQNVDTYEFEHDCRNASPRWRYTGVRDRRRCRETV
jgi:membrane protein